MPRKPKTKEKPEQHLSRDEAIAILEDIARNSGNAAARIAAIKQLEAMNGERPPAQGFDELDNVAQIRRKAKTT